MYESFVAPLNYFLRMNFQDLTSGSVNIDNFIVFDSVLFKGIAPIHDSTKGGLYNDTLLVNS